AVRREEVRRTGGRGRAEEEAGREPEGEGEALHARNHRRRPLAPRVSGRPSRCSSGADPSAAPVTSAGADRPGAPQRPLRHRTGYQSGPLGPDKEKAGSSSRPLRLWSTRRSRGGRLLVKRLALLVDLEDRLVLRRDGEWDHARDEPVGPHLVDLRLEVLHVLVDEVREPALALEIFVHRLALLAPLGDLPRGAGQVAYAVDDLVERPDPALDGEVAELLAVLRVVVPALGARVERVDERRSADLEGLADLVHEVDRVRGAAGRDEPRLRMPRGEHAGNVLLPASVHEPLLRARWRERGHGAVRRLARELDVRVRVALVVVEQDEAVVLLVGERGGDGAEAHVRAAAVAAERDDVDLLVLQLALAHQDLEAGRRAERGGAG